MRFTEHDRRSSHSLTLREVTVIHLKLPSICQSYHSRVTRPVDPFVSYMTASGFKFSAQFCQPPHTAPPERYLLPRIQPQLKAIASSYHFQQAFQNNQPL